jgi:hypothetical protein
MNLLEHKTEKLLAVAIAHDGSLTPHVRIRKGAAMSERLQLQNPTVRINQPVTLTAALDAGEQGVASVELSCWRPTYPFVTSFFLGKRSDWPFGEGDLPQVGATAPGTRDEFSVTFDPATRKVSWKNTTYASGEVTLDPNNLPMVYFTLRLFRREAAPQAEMRVLNGPAFEGKLPFRI